MKVINKNHYITAFSSDNKPVSTVQLEERFIIETNDCYCGQFKDKNVLRSEIDSSLINASTGPVYIEGVTTGDVICVNIHRIILDHQGVMLTYPGLGPLGEAIDMQETQLIPIRDHKVLFTKDIVLNVKPMIGVIGISPAIGKISTEEPGNHGGNLDTKEIKEGSKVYLPINVEGGLLAVGDLHALMGDGELCGMGVEIGGSVELSITKVNIKNLSMPIVETSDEFLIISSDEKFDKACKKGLQYATELLQNNLNIEFKTAYQLLSAVCDLRISQIVNPLLTIKVAIPKSIMPRLYR